MKKIITFIVLVISYAGIAQGVTITTDKTAAQLINEVLVSPTCNVAVENVTSSTGSTGTFGSTNGIGYFSNVSLINPNLPNNPNFPFKSGVVLTTGDVTKVPSPNNVVLSDGVAAWPGDTEMQTALLSQGININSVNASYLQFEFIATTTTFNLNFIFASEEYGASQCNYSDAFAFLIKNVTTGGPYQNVATVPGSGNTPITVATIRDALYNPTCSSVNPNSFGAYNGGGFGPAINFNGQTLPITASAPLVVGNRYRVKLVIADGNGNVGYDSAIFLEAQTLNIGGEVLGLDYVATNAGVGRPGLCSPVVAGSCPILQPVVPLPAGTTYLWKKFVGNAYVGVGGTAQTQPTLDVCSLSPAYLTPGVGLNYYSLTYTRPGCSPITDPIIIEVFAPINALAVVPPLTKCNTGATTYTFDLTKTANVIITNNTPAATNDDLIGYTITFHTSPANANNSIAVNNTYTISGADIISGVTLYAKIKNNNSGCYEIRSFDLKVVAAPVIDQQPLNLTECGEALAPVQRANFDLNNNLSLMLGGQDATVYSFSFHTCQSGAETSSTTCPLFVPITKIKNTITSTIYIRLENILDPTCFVTASFTVTVTPLAFVDILPDVIVCNSFVLPALIQPGAQYWSLTGGAATAGNIPYSAGAIITPGATPTTIWVYNENGICKTNDSFKITKANLPVIAPATASVCQTANYVLPPLAYGTYYTLAGGPITSGQTAPSPTLFATPGPKTVHVWFENTTETPACGQDYSFTITIIPFTLLPDTYTDKFACTSYTLNTPAGNNAVYRDAPNGGGNIINIPYTYNTPASQKTIYVYKQSNTTPNCTDEKSFTIFIGLTGGGFTAPANVDSCTPYTLPALDFGQYRDAPNGGGNIIADGTIIGSANSSTTIYFFVPGQACTGNLSFQVNISLPALAPIADVVVCDQFTLPVVPSHPNGKYYFSSGGTSLPYLQGETIYNTSVAQTVQTVYFYEKAAIGTCFVQEDFILTINKSPKISQRPISVVTCNQSFVLDDLEFGEYYKFPNVTIGSNPILPPTTEISSNDIGFDYAEIWVYAGSSTAGNTCFQEYSRKIYLVNTVVTDINDVTACDNYTLPPIVGPGDYWTAPGGPLGTGTKILPPYDVPAKIISGTTTLYVYAEDNNRVACSDEDAFTVTIVKTPDLNPVTAVTVCDSYAVPAYNNPMFTFTAANPGTVTKFYKNPGGALANPAPADVYIPGQFITNTNNDFSPEVVTIYPYTETTGTGVTCFDDEPFVITINRTPVIVPAEVVDVTACDSYTLPALTVGNYFADAAHTASLPSLTLTAASTTVYVYAETVTTPNCFAPVEDFVVTIVTTPIINPIAPVTVCDSYVVPNYNDPMFTFAPANPGTITKFYKNPGGPANNLLPSDEYTPITSSISNPGPNPLVVTIYAYSALGSVPCFDEEPFVVTINKSPVIVTSEVQPVTACDSYTLPTLTVGSYFSDAAHTTSFASSTLTDASTTVYVYAETATNPNCTDSESFVVTIVTTPTINPITPVVACDTYTVPQYSDPMFTSSSPITKFYKNAGGIANNLLASDEYQPGQIIPNADPSTPLIVTIYAYTQAGSVPCFTDEPLVVTINKSPVIVAAEVVPVTACDTYTLPGLTVGNYFSDATHLNQITIFTLTTPQTVYVYAENGVLPNVCSDSANFLVTINYTPQFTAAEIADVSTCNSYTLPALSIPGAKYYSGANATGSEILAGTVYTSDTTVFPYAETGTVPNCFISESINIQIYNVIELADVTVCGSYTLPILADPNANYYAFSGGVGLIAQGTTLLNSQTVYVNGTSPNSTCTDESDFILTINGQPIANDAADSVCDSDSSPFDGITPYDLTLPFITDQILGITQLPADFTITYYSDFNRTVQIIDPTISTLPIVYVFVTNNLSPTCPSPATVTINVIPLPNPTLDVPPICIDSETGIVTNSVIESGYNSLQYNIVWTKASDGTVVSNSQTFSTDVPGDYILNVSSNTVTTCASAPVPFTVIESAKPAVSPPISFETTGWFTNNQTITVNATPYVGNGSNFEYSLDGQTPQASNIFTNVGPGAHEITVIDINGCGSRSLPIPVELVTSPPAFTPNGDGINDRWDIKGDISYSTLTIYDRFGRLLKQLTQNSGGWDGTINSQSLPADDYWFSVNYVDSSGAVREFKSHFSLIR